MLTSRLLYLGSAYSIAVIYKDENSEVLDFISGLGETDGAHVALLIDRIRDHGPPQNIEKFRNEGEGIYSLKTKNVRIYGFFDGPKLFTLALGFMKNAGGARVERRYHQRATELRASLFEERGSL